MVLSLSHKRVTTKSGRLVLSKRNKVITGSGINLLLSVHVMWHSGALSDE